MDILLKFVRGDLFMKFMKGFILGAILVCLAGATTPAYAGDTEKVIAGIIGGIVIAKVLDKDDEHHHTHHSRYDCGHLYHQYARDYFWSSSWRWRQIREDNWREEFGREWRHFVLVKEFGIRHRHHR